MSFKRTLKKILGTYKAPVRKPRTHYPVIPSTDAVQMAHKAKMRTMRLGGLY